MFCDRKQLKNGKGKLVEEEKRGKRTFFEIIGDGKGLANRPLRLCEIGGSCDVLGELFARVLFFEEVVPMFDAGIRVHGRLVLLVNDARRRRLSGSAVISSELSPRGDDAVVVHRAGIAPYQRVAL